MLRHSHPDAHDVLRSLRRDIEEEHPSEKARVPAPKPARPGRTPPSPGREPLRERPSRSQDLPSSQTRHPEKALEASGTTSRIAAPRPTQTSRAAKRPALRPRTGDRPLTAEQKKAQAQLAAETRRAEASVPSDLLAYIDLKLRTKKNRLAGVSVTVAREALLRVVAATHTRKVPYSEIPVLLRRELRRELPSQTATRTAERVLTIVEPYQLIPQRPSSTPWQKAKAVPCRNDIPAPPRSKPATRATNTTLDISEHELPKDPSTLYRMLRETDLARDFGYGVMVLTDVFRALHAGQQPHVTGVFLDVLANRFALVVTPEGLRESRKDFDRANAALEDVQNLPTTKGIVLTDRGNRLMAWRMDHATAECASIEINALSSYLTKGLLPSVKYEVAGRRDGSAGAGLRDLAGFARNLRTRESRLRPLAVDGSGSTTREWTGKQLRRMGHKNAHRVREHLRLIPTTGERTVVSEHSRYGVPGWTETTLKIRLL